MNLIPWRKKHTIPVARDSSVHTPVTEFRSELERLFDRFFGGSLFNSHNWFEGSDSPLHDFVPTIDVADNEKQIKIHVEVPGIDPKGLEISVSGNTLAIHGEKSESSNDEGDDYYHCERRYGSFTRCVELPETADLENIDAEECNGVVTICVKKVPAAQAKKIDVKTPHELTTML